MRPVQGALNLSMLVPSAPRRSVLRHLNSMAVYRRTAVGEWRVQDSLTLVPDSAVAVRFLGAPGAVKGPSWDWVGML